MAKNWFFQGYGYLRWDEHEEARAKLAEIRNKRKAGKQGQYRRLQEEEEEVRT